MTLQSSPPLAQRTMASPTCFLRLNISFHGYISHKDQSLKSIAKLSITRKKSESPALHRQATLPQLPCCWYQGSTLSLLLVSRAPLSASNGIHPIFPHSIITYDKKIPNWLWHMGKKQSSWRTWEWPFHLIKSTRKEMGLFTGQHPGSSQ